MHFECKISINAIVEMYQQILSTFFICGIIILGSAMQVDYHPLSFESMIL